MSEAELNKIKNLIKSTTFLSSVEKQEWSSLLGVMNDKQLLDLENILQTTQTVASQSPVLAQPVVSKPIPAVAPKIPSQPVSTPKPGLSFQNSNITKQNESVSKPAVVQAENLKPKTASESSFLKSIEPVKPSTVSPAVQKLPVQPIQPKVNTSPLKNDSSKISSKTPLSNLGADKNTGFAHIMNWPKVGQKNKAETVKPNLNKADFKTAPLRPKTFSENLKNILAEKELSAPVVPVPKKVAATNTENSVGKVVLNTPVQKQEQVQPKPVVVEKQDIHIENLKTDTLILGNTPASQILSNAISKPVSVGNTKISNLQSSGSVKNNFSPISPKIPSQASLLKPEQLKPQAKVTISELAKKLQAASATNSPSQAANSGLNFDQKTIESKKKVENTIQLNKNIVKVDINSLTEVENFEVSSFKKNPDGIVLGFRDLIRKIGFYPVIFSLEKSPAYKKYLQTGIKMIKDLQDSEAVSVWSTGPELLEKKDFETFVDILRKIQAE